MQSVKSVQVGGRFANATAQELLERCEDLPIAFSIDRKGIHLHLIEGGAAEEALVDQMTRDVQIPPPEAPVAKKSPKPPRAPQRPHPKPGRKPSRSARLKVAQAAATRAAMTMPCKKHKAKAGEPCTTGGEACRDRRRIFRESTAPKAAASTPAAIPRRMKEPRGKPLSDIGLKVRELLDKGKSIKEISVEVGRPYATVWNHAKAYRKTKVKQAARPAEAPPAPAQAAAVPVGAAPVGPTPPSAAPPAPKVSKATASTHAIAERIARGEPSVPKMETAAEEAVTAAPPPPASEPVDLNQLTTCPHCGEPLAKSRYGRTVCRNDACDLWGRFVDQGEAKEGCNCERCTLLRVAEAADIEENGGIVAEAQDA